MQRTSAAVDGANRNAVFHSMLGTNGILTESC